MGAASYGGLGAVSHGGGAHLVMGGMGAPSYGGARSKVVMGWGGTASHEGYGRS